MPRIMSWFSPASRSSFSGSPETLNVTMIDTQILLRRQSTAYLRPSRRIGSSVLRLVRAAAGGEPRRPAETERCHGDGDDADQARDREGELGAARGAEPAGQDPGDGARAVEGVEVEADHPAAQAVGSGELHRR